MCTLAAILLDETMESINKHPYFSPPSHAQVRHHPAACELDAMQVRKIDCKPTRQRNQSSSPEKRLI